MTVQHFLRVARSDSFVLLEPLDDWLGLISLLKILVVLDITLGGFVANGGRWGQVLDAGVRVRGLSGKRVVHFRHS